MRPFIIRFTLFMLPAFVYSIAILVMENQNDKPKEGFEFVAIGCFVFLMGFSLCAFVWSPWGIQSMERQLLEWEEQEKRKKSQNNEKRQIEKIEASNLPVKFIEEKEDA